MRMSRFIVIAAVLVVALVAAAGAAAGNPFRFSDRAGLERGFYTHRIALPLIGKRYTTKSVGCAKAGVGRGRCVLVVSSRRQGVQVFIVRIDCPYDGSPNCRYDAQVLA